MTDSTFDNSHYQQYRVMKYIKDLILNWAADPLNIQDSRVYPLLYDRDGNLKREQIYVGTVFNLNNEFTGTTPAIIVSLGDIQYQNPSINKQGNPAFNTNPTFPPGMRIMFKYLDIVITVITLGYDANVLLTLLLDTYILVNMDNIQQDCGMLSGFMPKGVSAPKPVRSGLRLNAKELYMSTITASTAGHLTWSTDTQGPVYNGFNLSLNQLNKGSK